jgi:hypothetical protein
MTRQCQDTVIINGIYYLTDDATNGLEAFSPQDYGIKPRTPHTGCWRGYFCTYLLAEESLFLKELVVHALDCPPLDGITPTSLEVKYLNWEYTGLHIFVPFTGNVRLIKNPFKYPDERIRRLRLSFWKGKLNSPLSLNEPKME